MSTTARRYWLKALRGIGVKHFRAKSALGLPYICHVGDFAGEVPFLDRNYSQAEIAVMFAWCALADNPMILDIGGNTGFVATQLGQRLVGRNYRIFSFEPVGSTFQKLCCSIDQLGLGLRIHPVCCALSDQPGVSSIAFNDRESLFAQLRPDSSNARVGRKMSWCPVVTVDSIVQTLAVKPRLLKIDVEGYEAHVLRGARKLLEGPEAPALCFELNPITLTEVGSSVFAVADELNGYRFFYVDDFEGGRLPIGHPIETLTDIQWVCNLLALPRDKASQGPAIFDRAKPLGGILP
ncbi:MAG: hypothetical protein QOF24_433 [Verrucomicrobiota bacterium]|jgi:FkbM family methyltransferase